MPIEYFISVQEVEEGVPSEIQIVPLGDFTDGRGKKFRITESQIASMVSEFNKRKNDLVVDYEHQTLDGVQAPAAGWIKKLINKEQSGLWAKVEWTQKARDYLKEKEYRYLSPVLLSRKFDGKTGLPDVLHSAALTNDPAIDGMVPVVSKFEFKNNSTKENDMDEDLKKIAATLGLKPESSGDDVVQAVIACKAKADIPEVKEVIPVEIIKALDLDKGATLSEVKATVLAMKQNAGNDDKDRVAVLEKDIAKMKAVELVNSAMKDGKVSSAQKEWATDYATTDPKGFATFIAKATPVVPINKKTDPIEDDNGEIIDDATRLIAKQFGNTNEDLVKFGGMKQK